MDSRNSFLDSPNYRRITTPSQREAVSSRRRRSGFRGGGSSSSPIRRETAAEKQQRERQEALKDLQSELSDTGTRLTERETQAILSGEDVSSVRERISSRQRREGFASLQRDLSRSGTRLTPEESLAIAEGTADPNQIRSQVEQRRGREFSQQRSQSFVVAGSQRIPVSEAFASRVERDERSGAFSEAQRDIQEARAERFNLQLAESIGAGGVSFAGGGSGVVTTTGESIGFASLRDGRVRAFTESGLDVTTSLREEQRVDDRFFGERLQERIDRLPRGTRERTLRGAGRELLFGFSSRAAGAASFTEATVRAAPFLTPNTAPVAFAQRRAFGSSPQTERVLSGITQGFSGAVSLARENPSQLLFEAADPAATFVSRARSQGLQTRDLGALSFDASTVAGPALAIRGLQRASAFTARFRSDFRPVETFTARGFRVDQQGLTIRPTVRESVIRNVGDDFATIRVAGGVASTAEPLAVQFTLAGTTADGVTAQQNIVPFLRRDTRIPLRPVQTMDDVFFADPRGRLRTSRLGIDDTGFGVDSFSGETQFALFGNRPQAIIFRDANISGFPEDIRRFVARDPTGRTFTAAERARLEQFQLQPRSDFTAPGFLSIESEIVTTAPAIDVRRVGSTVIGRRRVPLFEAQTVAPDLSSALPNIARPSFSATRTPSSPSARIVSPLPRIGSFFSSVSRSVRSRVSSVSPFSGVSAFSFSSPVSAHSIPSIPRTPSFPSFHSIPSVPRTPALPRVPGTPTRRPSLEIPNFGLSPRERGVPRSRMREEFTPSLIANVLGIRGRRASRAQTGIDIRPININQLL